MNTLPEHSCDVLIIGSGAAGLSLALRLADQHQVIVLSKGPVTEGMARQNFTDSPQPTLLLTALLV